MPFDMVRINELIRLHIDKGKRERKNWDKWHAWYLSEFWEQKGNADTGPPGSGSENELNMEVNYPYPYIDTMTANTCPTNPQVTIKARDATLHGKAATAREALVNDTFSRDKMHRKARRISTFTSICGRGVSKTVWDARRRFPTTSVLDPRTVFFDLSADEWENIRYVCEAIVLTQDEFNAKIRKPDDPPEAAKYDPIVAAKVKPGAYPDWLFDKERSDTFANEASKKLFQWIVVYEFYDLIDDVFYHVLHDQTEPLYKGPLPNRFMRNPYELLTYNENLRDMGGVSDVKLIAPLQERLNEQDSLELWFTKVCIPVLYFNESGVDNPEDARSAIRNASSPGDIVGLKLKAERLLSEVLEWSRTPSMAPQHDKVRDRLTQVIEFILGLPQYSRGSIGKGGDTATEFALADAALRTRNGWRVQANHDWVAAAGKKGLAIWKEKLDPERPMTVPVPSAKTSVIVDRVLLAFPDPADSPSEYDDDYDYSYEVVAYSPTENNKLLMLQKIQQFFPVLQQLMQQGIDVKKFVTRLLDLLDLGDLAQDGPVAMPQMPAPPGGQAATDTTATGAMPPGVADVEAILPPTTRQFASQPKL
jgi:hypothetical protein